MIPEGVSRIGAYAFYDCYALTDVTMHEGVAEIGDWAFSGAAVTAPDGKYALPAGLKTVGFAAFVNTPGVTHWVLPAGIEHLDRRAFEFRDDGQPHTLTILNQDGAKPDIDMDGGFCSAPVTLRCYKDSAAWNWAKGIQSSDANGSNLTLRDLDDTGMLRVLLGKRDGTTVGATELHRVLWYDETAGDGNVLSTETSLEGGIDPEHVYRVDIVTTDALRYEYIVPEVLSLSVYPQIDTNVSYTLPARERVTFTFGVKDFYSPNYTHKLSLVSSVGDIVYEYGPDDFSDTFSDGTQFFTLELPRVESSLTVSMPDHVTLRMKHLQMLEAVDGVIDLGVLELEPNPLVREYPLAFQDAETDQPLDPGFDGEFTLWNKTADLEVPGVRVYQTLILPDNAYEFIRAGDELELRYTPATKFGYDLAEPLCFNAVRDGEEPPALPLRVNAPARAWFNAKGDVFVRFALFDATGDQVASSTYNQSLTALNLLTGDYTLLIWTSEKLHSIPSIDFFDKFELSENSVIREDFHLSSDQSLTKQYTAPPRMDDSLFAGTAGLSLSVDRAHMTGEMVPVYLNFSVGGAAIGVEKVFTITEPSGVVGRFVNYGGTYAYVNDEPAESAEVSPGGGHTRPKLVIRTKADQGVITFYARPEGQHLQVSELLINGVSYSYGTLSVTLPKNSFSFSVPSSITDKDSGNLQLSYISEKDAKALIFTDGELTDIVAVPARLATSAASLPYSFETRSSSGIHTVQAVIVDESFTGGETEWYELVLSDDETDYEKTVIASSPEYSITYLKEAIPAPLKLVITGTNGETGGWDGVKPVETAVVDYVKMTAEPLKFVVTYWNLNEDGTIKNDYTLDYALTMDHPELVTPGSVYLDVYCSESAEEPAIYTVPLTLNPLTGDFEGTLTFPGSTITANDMPYYIYVGYDYTVSASTAEISDEFLAFQAEKYAEEYQAMLDGAAEEAELFDLDVDLDMVELLLETDLAELPEESKQFLRDVSVNMKELAEIHSEANEAAAADFAALELVTSGGVTYGDCGGLNEEALLAMGARKLETSHGTVYTVSSETGTVVYDPDREISLRVDGTAIMDPDAVLAGDGALLALSDASLMGIGEEFAGELAGFRTNILTVLNLVESIVDKFHGAAQKELAALVRQQEMAQNAFNVHMEEMKNAMKNASTSDAMYQDLTKKLNHYQKLRDQASQAASDAKLIKRVKAYGTVKEILAGMRINLMDNSTNFAYAFHAEQQLNDLKKGALQMGGVGGAARNVFKLGGRLLGVLGMVIDVISLIQAYGDLVAENERYARIEKMVENAHENLANALYELYFYRMRPPVLRAHGMNAQQQYNKGTQASIKMQSDNYRLTRLYIDYFQFHDAAALLANISAAAAALTGSGIAAGLVGGLGAVVSGELSFITVCKIASADRDLDEDWEDYFEHTVRPVGNKYEDINEDGTGNTKRNKSGSGSSSASSRGGQGVRTPAAPQIDPAGYVYEAVASNRVEGATLSAWYLKDGEEVYWDDADFYDEVNPQITDETGVYSWYTPIGKWKVKAEKEGYEPANSEADPAAVDGWLPVPPPQMNVYIPMVSRAAPAVETILAAPTEVRITFTKYMDAAQLAEDPSLVRLSLDGAAAAFTLAFADLEESPAQHGMFYGRTLVLSPIEGRFDAETAEVTLDGSLRSYALTPMGEDFHSGSVPVLPLAGEIRILRDGGLSTDVGTQRSVTIEVLDTEGRLMENAQVDVTNETGKLELTDVSVSTDENGRAKVRLSGRSGGPDTVRFTSGCAQTELAARVSLDVQVDAEPNLYADVLSRDEGGVELTAGVYNDTDLPFSGVLVAAVYLDGRFLGTALSSELSAIPGAAAEAPLEIRCDASGDVTLKLFFVDGGSFAPLAASR